MKRLINENIERAAEWLKVKKELQLKLKELESSCEHWVAFEADSYKSSDNVTIQKNCLICDFCNKVLFEFNNNKEDIYKDFYEKQKKIFDSKYRTN